jgi:hypothetical protein
MSVEETAETIVELQQAEARLTAIRVQLLAHADRVGVAALTDSMSTEAWLRGELRVTPRQAKNAVRVGVALDTGRYPATSEGFASGVLQPDQVQVIIEAVDALPDLMHAEDRLKAEAHMAELGRSFDSRQLKALGRHLLAVVDPERAEQELAKRLEAEEEAAAKAVSFVMVDDGQGKARGRFVLPSLQGQMLKKLLEGFANPQIPDPIARTEGEGEPGAELEHAEGGRRRRRRLTADVLGDALIRLIEAYPIEKVPTSAGLNASVVVTMSVETLQEGLAHATVLGSDVCVSGTSARRMACAAGIIPAVLDGKGRVLDFGRRRRFASSGQRLAKLVEQDGWCAIDGCDRPASWGDAHHWKKRWTDSGTTNLEDLAMVCPRHHTLAHLPGRTMVPVGRGRFRIRRQT